MVVFGYIIRGKRLKKLGVGFYDLTLIFRDETKDIYDDHCCHFNKEGNEIFAREIAKIIVFKLLKNTPT